MKKTKLIVTIIVLICLAALAAFGVMHKHSANKLAAEEQRKAEEAARAEEEEQRAQALAEKIEAEKSEWYLLLVNEWNAIPDDFSIETAVVEDGYEMDARVKDALADMLADCRDAGYDPRIISSFRTHEYQQFLYDRTANKADTAIPGHSEHECGLAADIVDADSLGWGDPLIDKQEEMPAQQWLMQHCQDYGFILRYPKGMQEKTGIIYEPWHYRYVGKEHAAIIMENGICLEEYLDNMTEYYHPE